MGTWKTRGLRGSIFEEMINMTNESYQTKGLAIIQKIPTPITPIQLDAKSSTITLAYFGQKSTVDYIGVVQGVPICFDAKETRKKNFPLQNIHPHQTAFMTNFEKQKGIAFLLIRFQLFNEILFLPFSHFKFYWDQAQQGGRKSIPHADFDQRYRVRNHQGFIVHYLESLNLALNELYP